jgi:hypothetical protein
MQKVVTAGKATHNRSCENLKPYDARNRRVGGESQNPFQESHLSNYSTN